MMSKYPEPRWLNSHTEELRRAVIELYRSRGYASVPPEVIDRVMVWVLSEVVESLYRRIGVLLEGLYRRQEADERTSQLH
jgi:hypothetical protein